MASHLIFMSETAKGLDIVRTTRKRYDGTVCNPFDEYECGHWYARAMSSYALIEALTGVRYDAVSKTLYVNSVWATLPLSSPPTPASVMSLTKTERFQ